MDANDYLKGGSIEALEVKGELFETFTLGPSVPPGNLLLQNISFTDIKVIGEFTIRSGVILHNVEFNGITCKAPITLSTYSVFDNVVIKGKLKSLWIRPEEIFDKQRNEDLNQWLSRSPKSFIDISALQSDEVEILGIPAKQIKLDPNRHVCISSEASKGIDWEQLGIDRTSYWRLLLRRLKTFDVDIGVFSTPPQNHKNYETIIREKEKLNEAGFFV